LEGVVVSGIKSPVRAVILDWAGTTVDYGSRAPTEVFLEIFRRRGVEITTAEARGPMGRAKRDHIAQVVAMPRVTALWRDRFGRDADREAVDAMYEEFLPLQKEVLARGSEVIPGIPAAIAELRRRGIRIGSTTGYTRELMETVMPAAARAGYAPDVTICSDDVPEGRPAPWMNFLAAQKLGVYPMSAIVVVDDTPVGIQAAINAGAVAVAVTRTGNELGLSEPETSALPPSELRARTHAIEREFLGIGAHHAVASVADLPELIEGCFAL
jgi:phosphonoacetaldehyde hydrolase